MAQFVMTEKSEKQRFAKTSALLSTIVFMAYYFYGLRAVFVTGVSVFTSILADYLCSVAMKKKYDWGDLSPIMSGLLLALLMPASVPYTVMAFSAAFMSCICKNAFGGNRNLIFCPVCVAYIFTSLCFPSNIILYPTPEPFGHISAENLVTDQLARSYTYILDSGTASSYSILDIIWGKITGPMGSSAILIIAICAVALYFFGDIPIEAFFAALGANILINVIFPIGESGWFAVLDSLVAGSYFFVLTFMACDPRYVPKRAFSQIMYGVIFAGGSYLVRLHTGIENSAVFVLPMLCVFRDEFDKLTDALEKLLKFLWKYIKIFSAFAYKYAKFGLSTAAKFIAAQFDRLCEFISDKIVEASKKREAQKAEEAEKASAEKADEPSEEKAENEEKSEEKPDGGGEEE